MSDKKLEPLEAKKAIVFYQNDVSVYAEVHQIENGNFMEGRPLEKTELHEIHSIVKNDEKLNEFKCIPFRNILSFFCNSFRTDITWIYPAGKVKLLYSKEVKGLTTGEYFIPNILFRSNGEDVDVYAIKSQDILTISPDTQLYKAPFFNTSSFGGVCMGNVKIREGNSLTEMVHNIEYAFFNSVFTHTNDDKIVKGSILNAYNKQKKCFDEDLLVPSKKLSKIFSK